MSVRTKAIIAIVIASILWGSAGIVAKILLHYFDPFLITLFRSLIGSLCIVPFFIKQKRYPIKQIIIEVVPITLFSSLNFVFYYLGMQYTTVNASAVMYAATPLLVMIISALTIHEDITVKKFIGIVIGFIGVIGILILPSFGRGDIGFGTPKGNVLLLVAVSGWASYIVGSRYLTTIKKYSPIYITSMSLFISAIVLVVVNLFVPHNSQMGALLRPGIILNFLYLGLFVTVVTYVLFQWAIQHLSSTNASLTNYLQPIFAFYFSWIFLGEHITTLFLVGSLLVLFGVFIATSEKATEYIRKFRGKRRNDAPRPSASRNSSGHGNF